MKKITLTAIAFLISAGMSPSGFAGSDTPVSIDSKQQICKQLREKGAAPEELAQRGCCSWHGGVCSCSGGRVVCCDQTFSPSCLCNKEDQGDIKG